jgi:hypothetical protein
MHVKLNRNSRLGVILLECVIVVLVIVIGIIVIIQLIRFCKKWLGSGGGGHTTNDVAQVEYTNTYSVPAGLTPEVQKQVDTLLAQARTNPPCPGMAGTLKLPGGLPDGTQVFLQRSTNLLDWEDLFEVSDGQEWCDPAPPWPQAYYRLRAYTAE